MLFELVAAAGAEAGPGSPDIERFETALQEFERGAFDRAAAGFREVLSRCGGNDGPSSYYIRLSERLQREGVEPGWAGVVSADSK